MSTCHLCISHPSDFLVTSVVLEALEVAGVDEPEVVLEALTTVHTVIVEVSDDQSDLLRFNLETAGCHAFEVPFFPRKEKGA